MITATQIIAESTVPKAQAGKKFSSEEDGGFEALCSKIIDNADAEKDETKSEENTGTQNDCGYFLGTEALIGQIVAIYPGLCAEQPKTEAVSGGGAVADILEGSSSSGNKDIAAMTAVLGSNAEQTSADIEEIMARMPQITVVKSEKEQSPMSGTEDTDCSNLCPLENVSDCLTVEVQSANEAEVTADDQNPDLMFGEKISSQNTSDSETGKESGGEKANDNKETPKIHPSLDVPMSVSAEGAPGIVSNQVTKDVNVSMSVADAMQSLEQAIFESNSTAEYKKLEIQLEPENLGKLSITLSMSANGLTAKIKTDNPEAQGMLSGQISQLVQKLGDSGIRVDQMDVSCSDMSFGQNQQYSGNENAKQRFFFGKLISLTPETDESQGVLMYDLFSQIGETNNSVEYRV